MDKQCFCEYCDTKQCFCTYCDTFVGLFSDSHDNEMRIIKHITEKHPDQPIEYKVVLVHNGDFPKFYEKYVIPIYEKNEVIIDR